MSGWDVEAPAEWKGDDKAPGWFGGFFGFLGFAGHDGVGVVGCYCLFGSGVDGHFVARGWKTVEFLTALVGMTWKWMGRGRGWCCYREDGAEKC